MLFLIPIPFSDLQKFDYSQRQIPLKLTVLKYSSQYDSVSYEASNVVDRKKFYPNEWATKNEGPAAWIELSVENATAPSQLSMLAITPRYSSRSEIPKQVLASFDDGSVQVLNFDCSVNTQNFVVNKTSAKIKLTFQSICDSSFSNPGFGEIEAYSNKSMFFVCLLYI